MKIEYKAIYCYSAVAVSYAIFKTYIHSCANVTESLRREGICSKTCISKK